ncbi:Flp family type IVb pilin [Methylocaldum sp. MU1018]
MLKVKRFFARWFRNEEGASALEYALMAGLIAVAIATTVQTLGGDVNTVFQTISTKLQAVSGGTGDTGG